MRTNVVIVSNITGRGLGCGLSTVSFFSSIFTAVTTMKPKINI